MAKVKSIRVSMIRKISDENYGTFGAEVEEEIILEEGDDRERVLRKSAKRLEEELVTVLQAAYVKVSNSKKKKES